MSRGLRTRVLSGRGKRETGSDQSGRSLEVVKLFCFCRQVRAVWMGDHVVKAHELQHHWVGLSPPSIAIVFFADSLEERLAPDRLIRGRGRESKEVPRGRAHPLLSGADDIARDRAV